MIMNRPIRIFEQNQERAEVGNKNNAKRAPVPGVQPGARPQIPLPIPITSKRVVYLEIWMEY